MKLSLKFTKSRERLFFLVQLFVCSVHEDLSGHDSICNIQRSHEAFLCIQKIYCLLASDLLHFEVKTKNKKDASFTYTNYRLKNQKWLGRETPHLRKQKMSMTKLRRLLAQKLHQNFSSHKINKKYYRLISCLIFCKNIHHQLKFKEKAMK